MDNGAKFSVSVCGTNRYYKSFRQIIVVMFSQTDYGSFIRSWPFEGAVSGSSREDSLIEEKVKSTKVLPKISEIGPNNLNSAGTLSNFRGSPYMPFRLIQGQAQRKKRKFLSFSFHFRFVFVYF